MEMTSRKLPFNSKPIPGYSAMNCGRSNVPELIAIAEALDAYDRAISVCFAGETLLEGFAYF